MTSSIDTSPEPVMPPIEKPPSKGRLLWRSMFEKLAMSKTGEKQIVFKLSSAEVRKEKEEKERKEKEEKAYKNMDMGSLSEVLMRSFHKEWERKTQFMKDCVLFKDWMYKEVRAAGATSSISEYLNNKVIVKDLSTHKGTVYVVMSGTCMVVSKIDVLKESLPYGREIVKMIPYDKIDGVELTRYQRKDEIFLVIRKLRQGDCFGIGEQLPQTSVISEHRVEVLAVPTIHILRHGRGQSLERIQDAEMKKYPTLRCAFRNFQMHREWKMFKQNIREAVNENKQNKKQNFRRQSEEIHEYKDNKKV